MLIMCAGFIVHFYLPACFVDRECGGPGV